MTDASGGGDKDFRRLAITARTQWDVVIKWSPGTFERNPSLSPKKWGAKRL